MPVTAETFRLLRSQQGELNALIATLDGRVQAAWYSIRADLDSVSWGELTPLQRRNLTAALDTQWGKKLETIASNTKSAAHAAAQAAWKHQEDLASTQAPTKLQFRRPDPQAEAWMKKRTEQQIESKARKLSTNARKAMNYHLNRGVAVGANPKDTARRMTRMTRDLEDVIDGGMARALNIARTETLDSYRNSAQLTGQANQDVLEGWVWVAKLSARTCRSCWSKHGQLFELSDPGPNDHPQGRCARVPRTKTWKELGFDDIEEEDWPGLDGTKEFKRLTEAQQRQVLGDTRFEAWKAGQWPRSKWAVEVTPKDWRPFFRPAKPPAVSSRPVKPPRKPSKPPEGTTTPPKPSKPKTWAEEFQEIRARFVKSDPNVYGGGIRNQMHSNPKFMYDSNTNTYLGALDSAGDLAPLYADNLATVKDAGEALMREWYARVEKRLGGPNDSLLDDLNKDRLLAIKNLKQTETDLAKAYTYKSGAEQEIIRLEAQRTKLETIKDEARRAYDHARSKQTQAMYNWLDANPSKQSKHWYELARKAEGEELKGLLNELGLKLDQNKIEWRGLKGAENTKAKLKLQMEKAERLYPEEWLDKAAARNPRVWLHQETRGYNASNGKEIALSDIHASAGIGNVNHVAIHELGHSMEYAVEGLAQMEWAYLYERASVMKGGVRTFSTRTPIYRGTTEMGWEDEWSLHYTGKLYNGDAWEVFTTGIESLWAGSGYLDRGFKRWLLGVLSVL